MTVIDTVLRDVRPSTRSRAGLVHRTAHSAPTRWVDTYRRLLLAADAAAALAVSTVAGAVSSQWWLVGAISVTWIAVGLLCGAYRPHVLSAGAHDLRAVVMVGVVCLALLAVIESIGPLGPAHGLMVLALAAITVLTSAIRATGRVVIKARRRTGSCVQRVLVVGDPVAAVEMVERLGRATNAMAPVGVLVPESQIDDVSDLDLPISTFSADEPEATVAMAHELNADAVLLVTGSVPNAALRAVSRACEWNGMEIMFAPTVVDVATSAPVIPVVGLPILSVPRPGPSGAGRFAKQLLDRVVATAALAVLLPVFLAVAVTVKIDSRGPVFFRQTRVGENGRAFRMIKFRTMAVGAEERMSEIRHLNESDGPLFKLKSDPRVTGAGRILRRLSLDEMPQLLNVLCGHMSLVGPRPPLPDEVAGYTLAERRRLLVSPGITGLWQIGGRSNLGWADSVRLDLSYLESWSIPLDIRIMARTIPAVLRRRGAF